MQANDHENANDLIEGQLDLRAEELEKQLNSDTLTFFGPIVYGMDDAIRDALEARESKQEHLAVILETSGGYIEVAERIANTMRRHYGQVKFIIPNQAMSAGTVLVMSGDAIYMDYYSILGPIDPQIQRQDSNNFVPALGYLAQFERLVEKSRKGELTTAELSFLIEKFDPAELYSYEQAREHSVSLLKEWLAKYKFKNWTKTRTRELPVTDELRESRASEIARMLSDTDKWHSHSRGIAMSVLKNDLNLEIEDYGADIELDKKIKTYYRLLRDYIQRLGKSVAIHMKPTFYSF